MSDSIATDLARLRIQLVATILPARSTTGRLTRAERRERDMRRSIVNDIDALVKPIAERARRAEWGFAIGMAQGAGELHTSRVGHNSAGITEPVLPESDAKVTLMSLVSAAEDAATDLRTVKKIYDKANQAAKESARNLDAAREAAVAAESDLIEFIRNGGEPA
ncbi:hypothetical protein ABH922_003051 [Rhodococcus sp. 27YEA15]|uniref:hypothetical protein n=1 Tax=Rhodococcus sp. 27YEA15 TaxID=3156259 RepID=UPI003C7CE493